MKEYKFVPDVKGVSGHILLKVPSYIERLKLAQESGLASMKDGNMELDKVIPIIEKLGLFVLDVNIVVDGEKCSDLDSLGMYQAGAECINGCITILAGGIPSPKKKA